MGDASPCPLLPLPSPPPPPSQAHTLSAIFMVWFSLFSTISMASALTAPVLLEAASRAASLAENLPEVNLTGVGVGVDATATAAAEPTRARAVTRAS